MLTPSLTRESLFLCKRKPKIPHSHSLVTFFDLPGMIVPLVIFPTSVLPFKILASGVHAFWES